MSSFNLQRYLQTRADGGSVEAACAASGIDAGEALLHEQDIERGELTLPRAGARAGAREEQPREEAIMDDVTTTIRVGDGPEVPINLDNIDDPANAEAKEQIAGMFNRPGTDTGQRLKLYIERVERLDEEIRGLNEDKSDLFKEVKSNGFDTKTVKRIIKLRKMGTQERQEAEALIETYMNAIGMTPIEAAIALAA